MLAEIQQFLLDTLFPIGCLGCGKSNIWLCDSCLKKIPLKIEQFCPICEKNITPGGQVCSACQKKSAIDALLAASFYETEAKSSRLREYQFITSFQKRELVSQAVHCYKYRFVQDLHIPLGKIMLEALLNSQLPLPDFIIPVPLHKKRLRRRGFNQAELLANYLSKNLAPGFEIPALNNLLIRKKNTRPQMEIKNYSRRKENLKGAFTIVNVIDEINTPISSDSKKKEYGINTLGGKTILLVDDIATTGSTLFECAKTLKQNGAKKVFAAVVARQEYNKT